jgi:Polysaccharide deacetylase
MARVIHTRYPRFIFGMPMARGEVPVFRYHEVDTAGLARDLEFLRRNGYRTLSLEEFDQSRRGRAAERSVLITFDDARRSFWEVALPLLREFRARAALFVPTWWMSDGQPDSGRGRELFMSWSQLAECAASGLVDVQSQAHRHALVHTRNELVDFASPEALDRYDVYDWPMRNAAGGDELGPPALGTPVYRATPLLSATQRYLESDALTDACRQFVDEEGGARFFDRPDWRKLLRAFHSAKAGSRRGRVMPAAAFSRLVASEFEQSRDEFRARLGYAPTWLAFPWRLGTVEALQTAKRVGIQAAFGVALDYRAERAQRLPLRVYGRLQCDWIRSLPGAGRASVFDTIGRKLTRFSNVQHLAH